MKTAAQRIAHYNARMSSSLIDPVLTAVNAIAQANYLTFASDITQKQIDTVAVLDTDGIGAAFRYLYLAYSNQLYHLSKFYSGTALVTEATILHAKYVAQFLATATLKKIALNVYTITIP
jgi:hypothetical protein